MRNKFFWIGFIYFIIMLILFFLLRFISVFINYEKPDFSYDPIFYIIPITFILGGIINWESKLSYIFRKENEKDFKNQQDKIRRMIDEQQN